MKALSTRLFYHSVNKYFIELNLLNQITHIILYTITEN